MMLLGLCGMGLETISNALFRYFSNEEQDKSIKGRVSIYMFPIYVIGLTYGFDFIEYVFPDDIIRWSSYPLWIWVIEIIIGSIGKRFDVIMWDYSKVPWGLHWRGLISFFHWPLWIGFGILMEIFRGVI
jgi:hypothetical protein